MYEIGDYIVKPSQGVCKVEDIVHLDASGIDKNRLYYLLIPIEDPGAKIYVPTDTSNQNVRKVMTEKEAKALIRKIPDIQEPEIVNEREREKTYQGAVRSGNPERMVGVIKTTYQRRQQRILEGKKSTQMDENYLRAAENHLYSELGFALHKEKDDVLRTIQAYMGEE